MEFQFQLLKALPSAVCAAAEPRKKMHYNLRREFRARASVRSAGGAKTRYVIFLERGVPPKKGRWRRAFAEAEA